MLMVSQKPREVMRWGLLLKKVMLMKYFTKIFKQLVGTLMRQKQENKVGNETTNRVVVAGSGLVHVENAKGDKSKEESADVTKRGYQ